MMLWRRLIDYCNNERRTEYTFRASDFGKRYNGAGFRGTGGPKVEWLKYAVNKYLDEHYPELKSTMLMEFFKMKQGWKLVFTVPYWAASQPIEQVWAYMKNYVSLRWFSGRKAAQLPSQIICGMCGAVKAGDVSKCWVEPKGLREHTGLTPGLAAKFINHSHKNINKFIAGNDHIKHMGSVGEWSQEDIDNLVLPVCGGMDVEELDDIDNESIVDDIVNNL